MGRNWGACFLVAGVCAGWLTTARATTFVLMDEEQLLETSDAVVVGTVTTIESAEGPNGGVYTYVHLQPSQVIKGNIGDEEVVIREPGGTFRDRSEWVFGAPEFWVGERSLLFLSRNADGTLQTHSLSMGKFTLGVDTTGHDLAVRDLGYGAAVLLPDSGEVRAASPQTQAFFPLLGRLQALASTDSDLHQLPLTLRPPEIDRTPTEEHESFTFLGSPSRWFEPDSGLAVPYRVDSAGDSTLGFTASQAAVDGALAAWTTVATSNLILADAGTTAAGPFNQCSVSRVVFNDPASEITDPSGCTGVLAVGGYCVNGETKAVNGTTFRRIVVGKVTFNNGWGGCAAWNQCNVAEVATHELGHTIGLGHSSDPAATMSANARFDGRCAALGADDVAAVTFIYPGDGAAVNPTSTPSPSTASTQTPHPPLAPTTTFTRVPTAIPTRTRTRTPTLTPTPTFTRTPTPVPVHDSVVQLLRPRNLTIRAGRASVSTRVRVKVRNGDLAGTSGTSAHTVRLLADDGDCPPGTVVGLPDFDRSRSGDQDAVALGIGQSRRAVVMLSIGREAFAGVKDGMPLRCRVGFTATTVAPVGSIDPVPTNDSATLELTVVDKNAPTKVARKGTLKSLAPLTVRIPRGRRTTTKKVRALLTAETSDDERASLAIAGTDCPANAVDSVRFAYDTAGGRTRSAAFTLTFDNTVFTAPHARSPARCSITVTAAGAGVDAQDTSRTSMLVIDVIDKNDF